MSLVLCQFPRSSRLPNDSPFCLKVEAYLRLTALPYAVREVPPFKSPSGKLPYLVDDHQTIADSSCIVEHLEAKLGGRALDAALTPAQRAQARLIQRTVEEHLYWASLWWRWLDDAHWPTAQKAFFGALPVGIRQAVSTLVRRKLRRDARGHGLALHPPQEILRRGEQDLVALADTLGEQPYFLGANPTTVDACAYGFLGNILGSSMDTPLTAALQRHPNLVAYCARMQARCFPELV